MIQKFLDYIAVERKYSPLTVRRYGDDLRMFCEFLNVSPEEFTPKMVTTDDIRAWMIQMMDEGMGARSVRRRLSALRSYWKFCLKTGIAKLDPTQRIIPPKMKMPLPVFYKESEMEKAIKMDDMADDWLSLRDALIIEMLYQTGMRRAEMAGLKDSDVDFSLKQIRVLGKRRKERLIPVGDGLLSLIRRYLDMRGEDVVGMLFVKENRQGERVAIGVDGIYKVVHERMGEVSSLKKQSPHVLRHTFATTMLNNGADIETIRNLLGHASLAATQVYTHTTFEQIKKEYACAHPRAKSKRMED